jgi:hypothetical protein
MACLYVCVWGGEEGIKRERFSDTEVALCPDQHTRFSKIDVLFCRPSFASADFV